jgi:hypothetical protein
MTKYQVVPVFYVQVYVESRDTLGSMTAESRELAAAVDCGGCLMLFRDHNQLDPSVGMRASLYRDQYFCYSSCHLFFPMVIGLV